MSKFETLTRHIAELNDDNIGSWVIDRVNDGTPEHPKQMPFVDYSRMVQQFIKDVYEFSEQNADFRLNRYGEILERNGLEWGMNSMCQADVSCLDEKCVMALIMGAVRAERFCDGALLGFFKNGTIRKWLERLEEFDREVKANG